MIRILLASILLLSSACTATPKYPISDHYDGKSFRNPNADQKRAKGWTDVLKWKWNSDAKPWPDYVRDNVTPNFKLPVAKDKGAVTFINHATTLVQMPGLNVLTDPVWSKRVSPFSWIGPKRHRDPGAAFESLPKVDAVVISHNHYDHLDLESLKMVDKRDRPLFLVPLGNGDLLKSAGIENVRELDWWESAAVAGGTVTLVPTQHWSARGLFDRYEALWGGYVMEAGSLKVYFAGDTGYSGGFAEAFKKFGAFDLSLIPIGAYEPRWFMSDQHIDPVEAVRAHGDLQSRKSVAIHFGTFQLADDGVDDPPTELRAELKKRGISEDVFVIPLNGTSVSFGR